MSSIIPFSGLRFSQDKIEDMAQVISPPYDKIPTDERVRLWNRHDHNIVKLILPPPDGSDIDTMTQSMDGEGAEWYGMAAQQLQAWIKDGILKNDPSQFYVYKQTYSYKGGTWTRVGLFGALRLEEGAGPHSHEHTFEGPKADRLRLLRKTNTNLSPIFLIADGEINGWNSIFKKADDKLIHFHDLEGQEHTLLGISDESAIEAASAFLDQRTLVIADGHHRYETACNYCREMKEKSGLDPATQSWGYMMVIVVPIASPGLLVLPTHRVLSQMPDSWLETLKQKASSIFEITPLGSPNGDSIRERLGQLDGMYSIAVVSKTENLLLTLKKEADLSVLNEVPEALRHLNVSLLHHYLYKECLSLSDDLLVNGTRYVRGEEESIDLVRNGEAEAAFLLAPIPTGKVFDISLQGVRMPQKSTDFYPKIPTGLLMRSFEAQKI